MHDFLADVPSPWEKDAAASSIYSHSVHNNDPRSDDIDHILVLDGKTWSTVATWEIIVNRKENKDLKKSNNSQADLKQKE